MCNTAILSISVPEPSTSPPTKPTTTQTTTTQPTSCFVRHFNRNALFGLITNGPYTDSRPDVLFLGFWGDNVNGCEQACYQEPGCVAYTLFDSSYSNGYSGLYYGRSGEPKSDYFVSDSNVMSGFINRDNMQCMSTRKIAGKL